MATCDPQALARDSSCFFCLPPGYYYPIKLALLARWLKTLNPAADTSVAGLLATASCFACPPQGELVPLKLALLCDIGGGGGSGGTPAAPLTLTISGASAQANVVLNWTQGTAPDMNEIWVSTDFGVTYNLRATVSGSSTSYSDVTGMGGADFWVYKVRAKASGLFSSFSPLAAISSGKSFANDTNLNGYQFFPVLYVCLSGFNISTSITPTVINLAVLAKIGGSLNAQNCPNLTSLSVPVLATVGGDFTVNGAALTSLSLPALVSVGLTFDLQNNPITSVSAPLLATVGFDFNLGSCTVLTSVSFPSLTTITELFSIGGCTLLTSASFPVLSFAGNGNDFLGNNCPALTTWSAPNLILVDNANLLDFTGSGLAAGSSAGGTGVNGILRRCVASNLVSAWTIDLSGGTNAPPNNTAGNTGLTDKATLIANGQNVITN